MATSTTPLTIEDIPSLKVVSLRQELDKRGLEKSGLKADLVKRLEKSLLEESITSGNGGDDIVDGSASEEEDEDAEIRDDEEEEDEEDADADEENMDVDEKPANGNLLNVEDENQDTVGSPEDEEGATVEDNQEAEDIQEAEYVPEEQDISEEDSAPREQDILEDEEVLDQPESEQQNQELDSNDLPEDERNEVVNDEEIEEEEKIESDDEDQEVADSTDIVEENEDKKKMDTDSTEKCYENKSEGVNEKDKSREASDGEDDSNEIAEAHTEVDQSIIEQNAQSGDSGNDVVVIESDQTEKSTAPSETEIETANNKDKDASPATEEFIPLDSEVKNLDTDEKKDDSNCVILVETIVDLVENASRDDSETDKPSDGDAQNCDLKTSENIKTCIVASAEKDVNDSLTVPNDSIVEIHASPEASTDTISSTETKGDLSSSKTSADKEKNINKDCASAKGGINDEDKKKDLSRCLWISGLSSVSKAVDLKNTFNKVGKVIGAKVVTSAKTPGSQCFGFVTMSTEQEASAAIEQLHKSVLHEKTIQVEKAKSDPTPAKKPIDKSKTNNRTSDDKSKSRTSSKSQRHRSSSSKTRRDDRSSRHSREEPKKTSTKKDTKSRDTKRDEDKKGTSSKNSSPKAAEKRQPKTDDKNSREKTSKEKEVSTEKEGEKKKDMKSIDQLRKERAEKIEREHQLREERKKKERERDRQLREERRREQEKREKERKERARKEAERVRKDREKQRELERQREREREKERERFIRERKEKEDRERREREKERERLERERLERERLERERREQERLEKERIERDRIERERLEKERLAREERESRIERERQRLEQQRLERERAEREREKERRVIDRGIDRGLTNTLKRPAPPSDRNYPETKRGMHDQSRKDFFSASSGNREDRGASQYVQDDVYDVAYQRRNSGMKSDRGSREGTRQDIRSNDSRRDERLDHRRNTREEHDIHGKTRDAYSTDIRRVVQRQDGERSYPRERSPHRGTESGQKFRGDVPERAYGERSRDYDRRGDDNRGANWLSAPNANAPKTLSDVLGRAGLTGILGSQLESSQSYSPRRTEYPSKELDDDRLYAPGTRRAIERNDERHPNDRNMRMDDRSMRVDERTVRMDDRTTIREERRDNRVDARDIRNDYRNFRGDLRGDSRDVRVESRDARSDPRGLRNDSRERGDSRDMRNESRDIRGGSRDIRDESRDIRGDSRDVRVDSRVRVNSRDVRVEIRQDYPIDHRETRVEPLRDSRSHDGRVTESRDDRKNRIDERRDVRPSERRPMREELNPISRRDYPAPQSVAVERGIKPSLPPAHASISVTERRGLHPLAAEIARPLPTVVSQPRVLPITDLFGRPLQPVVPNPALQAGYAQGLALHHQVAQTGIQLGRDGRLEYTRVAQAQPGIPQIQRRY